MDCVGARVGATPCVLTEMKKPGDSYVVPIPKHRTLMSWRSGLSLKAGHMGIRISIITKGMPKDMARVTCVDHVTHREQQRRLAAQAP